MWGESAWGKSSAGTDTYSVEPSLLPPPNRFGRPNLRFAEGCSGGRCRARDRGSRSSAQAAPEALRAIQITLPVCRRAAIGASALPRMLPIATIGTDAARYALASRAREHLRKLSPRRDVEVAKRASQVRLHCLLGHEQLLGDLSVRTTRCSELDHASGAARRSSNVSREPKCSRPMCLQSRLHGFDSGRGLAHARGVYDARAATYGIASLASYAGSCCGFRVSPRCTEPEAPRSLPGRAPHFFEAREGYAELARMLQPALLKPRGGWQRGRSAPAGVLRTAGFLGRHRLRRRGQWVSLHAWEFRAAGIRRLGGTVAGENPRVIRRWARKWGH